jgi:hypothetical protein
VILQDAALLLEMNAYKDHPMFHHEVLHSKEFKTFAVTLRGSIQATPMPANVLMQQLVPIMEEKLSAVRTDVSRLYTLMLDKTQSSSDIFINFVNLFLLVKLTMRP